MKQLCTFGSSSESIERSYIAVAEELGREAARRGCGVIYGAGKYGIMGAVSRGVRAEGGALIGVSPDFFVELDVLTEDYGELLLTPTMRERKAVMEDKADAFVICPGGIGTFEEFFEVITLKQLGRHQKPIIILNTNGYYTPMLDMMEQCCAQQFMSEDVHRLFSVAESIDEVFDQLENYSAFQYNKYKK